MSKSIVYRRDITRWQKIAGWASGRHVCGVSQEFHHVTEEEISQRVGYQGQLGACDMVMAMPQKVGRYDCAQPRQSWQREADLQPLLCSTSSLHGSAQDTTLLPIIGATGALLFIPPPRVEYCA